MGRNRGQNNDKKKGDEGKKVKIRRPSKYNDAKRTFNKKMRLLREARRAEKKLAKLVKRGWEQKPGGILEGGQRAANLYGHIIRLKAHASSIRY